MLLSLRRIVINLIVFIALMGLWELAIIYFKVRPFIVPAPSAVARALYNGIVSGLFWTHMLATLSAVVMGYFIALSLALMIGTLVALNKTAERFIYPYIVMFQSMPKVALAPIFVIWFGLGLTSKVVNVTAVCFFPLLVNTIVGLRSADTDRVNLLRSLGANVWQVFWMLRIYSAMPFIMAGMEVAVILALIGAIVGEFLGAERGLGMLIQSMSTSLDVAGQFSVLVLLSAIGLTLSQCLKQVRNRALFWDVSRNAPGGAAGKI